VRRKIENIFVTNFPSAGRVLWEIIHIKRNENILLTDDTEFILPKKRKVKLVEPDDLNVFETILFEEKYSGRDDGN
jgi:hypothetical protein